MPRRWHQVPEKQASQGRRWQESPVAGESAQEAVKTIARGMLGDFRCDLTNACALSHYHCTRGYRAHRAPGIPCALVLFEGISYNNSGAIAPRGRESLSANSVRLKAETVTPPRHCEEPLRRRFHGEWIATKSEARLRLQKPLNLETTMLLDHPSDGPTAI